MKRLLLFLMGFCAFVALESFSSPCRAASEPAVKLPIVDESAPWPAPGPQFTLMSQPHPLLFFTRKDLPALTARTRKAKWARQYRDAIIRAADKALSRPLDIPKKQGQWSQHYVCPACGIDLVRRHDQNVCPRCGKTYSGWPYDEVIAARQHHANINAARDLGLAYQFTGDSRYAARAREILLGYAARYPGYKIHDYKGGRSRMGARLFAQTLDEAVAMIPFVWAYDLVYDAPGMSAADRHTIENQLFRPAAAVIRRNDMGVSNWQSWHNAAMTAIGVVLHDPAIVNHAVNGRSGFLFQMTHSVLPDGFWYEGTVSYHIYALDALQKQVLALKMSGLDFYREPHFVCMYDAPLDYAFPDGRFPAVNDSDPVRVSSLAPYYEVAYGLYRKPRYGAIAQLGDRHSEEAFFFGAAKLPKDGEQTAKSHNFPGLGAIMLREENTSNPLALHLDYGPHGGAHGHQDKLSVIFFANGTDIAPDPGRLSYGAPLHKAWYKRSIAHNTIIMDGQDQLPAEGRLVSSSLAGEIKTATAACDTAYNDVQLTRSVALAPEYLLDVSAADSATSHTFDLAWHIRGSARVDAPLKPAKLQQNSNGYEILTNTQAASSAGQMKANFARANAGDSVQMLQQTSGQSMAILADGLTDSDATTCPVLLSRQTAARPRWVTLLIPRQRTTAVDQPDIRMQFQPTSIDEGLITVQCGNRTDRFQWTADAGLDVLGKR